MKEKIEAETDEQKHVSLSNFMSGWVAGVSVLECPPEAEKNWVFGWREGRESRRAMIKKMAAKLGLDIRTVTVK